MRPVATAPADRGSGDATRAIEIDAVSKIYRTRDGREVTALAEVTRGIAAHEFVALLGPSGCGKTTLLKIIGDIIPPSSGSILVEGRAAIQARRLRLFGFFFQDDVLLPWRSVLRNVTLPYELSGEYQRDREEVRRRAGAILKEVGLEEFSDAQPRELSGGMRQRVALARGLVFDPRILLMDEPFASLDELTRTEMNLLLQDVYEQTRKTVVFVTHHIPEAVFLSSRVLVMSARPGRIVEDLPIDLPRPRTMETRHSAEFQEYARALERWFHRK